MDSLDDAKANRIHVDDVKNWNLINKLLHGYQREHELKLEKLKEKMVGLIQGIKSKSN